MNLIFVIFNCSVKKKIFFNIDIYVVYPFGSFDRSAANLSMITLNNFKYYAETPVYE